MKTGWLRWITTMVLVAVALLAAQAWGQGLDQAMPGGAGAMKAGGDPHAAMGASMGGGSMVREAARAKYATQNRDGFNKAINLDAFRRMSVQHQDHLKILDSWARQVLWNMRNRESYNGQDALRVVLDMTLRPEAWMGENFIYVRDVPIREELGFFAPNPPEQQRIRETGLVSPDFLLQERVWNHLADLALDSRKLDAANRVRNAVGTFLDLGETLHFLPPAPAERGKSWVNPADVVKVERDRLAAELMAAAATQAAATGPATAAGVAAVPAATVPAAAPAIAETPLPSPYTPEQVLKIRLAFQKLVSGWQDNEVELANQGLAEFAAVARAIDPAAYPSATKRGVELWYNRTFSGRLVAFIYAGSMVLFFMIALGVTKRLRKTALSIFSVALAFHVLAMAVRWWISGRIPIQNQFESVMASACLGCCLGLVLELWKKNGIFGAAFSFVGFLAATSLLAAPYVFGRSLGVEPGKVAGILTNTIWLYIHVNITIWSYALILASAAIAGIYLILRQWYWINPIEPGFEARGDDTGGTTGGGRVVIAQAISAESARVQAQRESQLETMDQANMVVVQMAFWMLGIGILCGAVWADQSWGRPWGWDPKETFALVTWMVYLVLVHVRLVVKAKAHTTAWLSIAGCALMLFNWIGVNFVLVGLHSYA